MPGLEQPQLITHSSGTTGVPKLVVHSARSFAGHARPQVTLSKFLRVKQPYLLCLSHVHARTMSGLLTALAMGVNIGFMTDPSPRNLREFFLLVQPGIVETVPNAFIRWEAFASQADRPFRNVRMFVSSFDAVHPRTVKTLLAGARRDARYMQAYGQTETGPITVKEFRTKSRCLDGRCVGRAVFAHTGVRIVKDADIHETVAAGTPGNLFAKTVGVCHSYLGRSTKPVEGWWATGDYGVKTANGCIHLLDREVDKIDGVRSLLEIEDSILEAIPSLVEVVLINDGSDRIQPFVCTHEDAPLDMQRWTAAVSDHVPMNTPLHCRWQDIPFTATWKVKRPQLAREFHEGKFDTLRLNASWSEQA